MAIKQKVMKVIIFCKNVPIASRSALFFPYAFKIFLYQDMLVIGCSKCMYGTYAIRRAHVQRLESWNVSYV